MGLLRTRELSASEEAARQEQIATEVQRQHDERLARERDLTYRNAARREQIWAEQQQAYEAQMLEQVNAEEARKAEEREAQHRAELARNQELQTELRRREERRSNIEEAIARLSDPNPDLSSVAAAIRAAERAAQVTALRQLWDQVDADLVRAERAVGRHRIG